MEIHRIGSDRDPYFETVWEIYQYSFPEFEKRTPEHQCTAFRNDRYHLDVYLVRNQPVGFIAYWVFEDYTYIEHYAMARESRGKGYGSRILEEFLGRTEGKTVVLEIDPLTDEISRRRLTFYERLGFVENPFQHKCHEYQPNLEEGELLILTHPREVDCDFYARFSDDLKRIVMAR